MAGKPRGFWHEGSRQIVAGGSAVNLNEAKEVALLIHRDRTFQHSMTANNLKSIYKNKFEAFIFGPQSSWQHWHWKDGEGGLEKHRHSVLDSPVAICACQQQARYAAVANRIPY